MRISEILALAKLGYTKDEIKELAENEKIAAQSAIGGQNAGNNTSSATDTPAANPPVSATPAQAAEPGMSAVIEAINSLKETIQASNITNSNRGGTTPETVEDILNIVINDTKKE